MAFSERFNQLKLYASNTVLNVLVWGSGAGQAQHFEKRKKIREELQKQFVNAAVHFSEDPGLLEELTRTISDAKELSVPQQELWHLGACDVCVALDTSEGVHQEIAHFVSSPWSSKLIILTNSRFKDSSGFPGMLRENNNQIFYEDSEYDSCNLVNRVVTRVFQVALGKVAGLVT